MVEHLLAAGNQLGESPVWRPDEGALYWVDIPKRLILRHAFATGLERQWTLPASIGSFVFRAKGGMVVSLKTGIYFFNPDNGDLWQIHNPEADLPDNRSNEGK